MATITEDYISFEIAKLLKENGFNEKCFAYYYVMPHKTVVSYDKDFPNNSDLRLLYTNIEFGSLPTLQMAMKWLREVHNIHIDIDPDWTSKGGFAVIGYCFNIHFIANPWYEDLITYPTYEQAVEAAIKYCLEHLI